MVGNKFFIFLIIILLFSSFNLLAETEKQTLSGLNVEEFSQGSKDDIVWSKNPFLKPARDVAVDQLYLSGIVFKEDDAAALINSTMVREGNMIGSSEVLSIEPESVILRNENGIFSLSLRGGGL